MKRRGITLTSTMWFVSMLLLISMASAVVIDAVQARLKHHKLQENAAVCAQSGIEYASAMVRWGKWHGNGVFTSPDLGGCGTFTVRLQGRQIHSIGQDGPVRETLDGTLP